MTTRAPSVSRLRTDTVVELVETATKINSSAQPLVPAFMNAELQRMAAILDQLQYGQAADHPGDDLDWTLTLTSCAQRTISATSMIGPSGSRLVDEGFWQSPIAYAHLERQREAVDRGVVIRRLFIPYDRRSSSRTSAADIIERNREAGMDVRVLSYRPAVHGSTP